MSIPVAPASVTFYDVIKDLGFPIAVSLILLFQIGPKLDEVLVSNQNLTTQVAELTLACRGPLPS